MKTATLLVSLVVSVVVCAQQPSGSRARVEVPGVVGVLEIDVGATPWHLDFLPEDKWTMLQARQRPDHIAISALLRQVEFAASAQSCKNELWPRTQQSLGERISNLQESFTGGFTREEYTGGGTGTTASHHLVAYLGSRNLCTEVHLTKEGFTLADQKSFEQILSSVRLLPDETGVTASGQAQASSSALMAQGDEMRAQTNYGAAAKSYQRAFDQERANRTFDNDMFLDLISKLGFAYRMNGQLAKAKETLDYGLSQNADYPIFHYDMACTYAQMGKMDESLGELKAAYQHSAKVAPVQLPNHPEEDACFAKWANDPRFMDVIQKLQLQ